MGGHSNAGRTIPVWTAALLLSSGLAASHAQPAPQDDSFFTDLALADAQPAAAPAPAEGAAAPAKGAVAPAKGAAAPAKSAAATSKTATAATAKTAPAKMAPVRTAPLPSIGNLIAKGLAAGDTTGAIAPRQTLDRAGWMPEHAAPGDPTPAVRDAKAVPAKDLAKDLAKESPKRTDKAAEKADPEPDIAIEPATPVPSKDPLDHAPTPVAAAPAPEALPPLNAALKAALDRRDAEPIRGPGAGERRKERAAVSFFYAAHGFAPVWSADGRPVAAVDSVVARLGKAGEDALTLPAPVPTGLKADGSPEEIVAAELALTDAVVAYARQASGSRVDPKAISPLIGSLPALADPAEVLDAVSGAGAGAGDRLAASNPAEPRYAALREKLAELRASRRPTPAAVKPIAAGPTLHIGMRDQRVPDLRARLGAAAGFGDDPTDTLFDPALSSALADWQRANALPTSGALDKRTLAALNGVGPQPSARLEGTLIATMEMWRWMPRDLGADRIEVNIPDYLVRVYRGAAVMDEHRVVVGKTDTPTPLFSNAMKYLIVNPYWNVPQSIIKKEMLPKGGGSLDYLDGRGYEVDYHGGFASVRQLPGPKNALGQIKFLFPNDYSVYLHDTPSKSLFAASKRAFSHGCVRVDKPFAFAESVLNDAQPDGRASRWSQDKLEDMVGEKEHYVNLARPLPIHIEYFTASIEPGGRVKLREDIYGYTHAVATALGQDSEPAAPVFKPPKEPKPDAVAARARRRTVAEADADPQPAAPPPQASRGFWGSIFDPR